MDKIRITPEELSRTLSKSDFALFNDWIPDVEKTLEHLEENDLAECRKHDGGITWVDLTYEGKNYKEFGKLRLFSFLIESIGVPILVSFIVALITALIVA
jgi:hypothetical protein